jgi:hypothetical protein
MLESIGNEKITSVQAWRYPLMKPTQDFVKKIVKLPYDDIFHSGLNLNGKYNLEKDVLLKLTRGREQSDIKQNKSDVYKVSKDITFNQLFDGLRRKMGDKLTEYNARSNNCQDFSMAILSVLGIDNSELKRFIKQDADKVYKSFGVFEKVIETGANVKTYIEQVYDRLTKGEGACQCGGAEPMLMLHNNNLPRCKVQF